MSKIFAVTAGCYSDYRIVAIYSTQDLAEACLAHIDDSDKSIEEWELDAGSLELQQGLSPWFVRISRDGRIDCAWKTSPPLDAWDLFNPGFTSQSTRDPANSFLLMINCWARDEAHAVKIASERATQVLANGNWRTA